MQPETEADGAREGEKWAEAEAETEAEQEELRTFSNINTLACVLKLWPGTCVAQTGLPITHPPPPRPLLALFPPSIPNIIKHMRAGRELALRSPDWGRQANAL